MPLTFEVLRSQQCDVDLEAIFDHLFKAYCDLGEPVGRSFDHAKDRVLDIEERLAELGSVPYQGTLVPQILEGLRYVRKAGAVFYFTIDEVALEIRVLAVFFSGQDHRTHILNRIAATHA